MTLQCNVALFAKLTSITLKEHGLRKKTKKHIIGGKLYFSSIQNLTKYNVSKISKILGFIFFLQQ